jgi:hypothetical protein
MGDETLTGLSSSEDTLKSLHVVCSPGKGAFSVYMFLRYALAQRSDPQISEVKMTMLCREDCDAEEWWNLWSKDEKLSQKLGAPKGWKPEFIPKNVIPKSLNQLSADIYVFILAGGDQGRLIRKYRDCKGKNANAKLVTEEDITSYSDGNFAFKSTVQDTPSVLLGKNVITPEEGLSSIEIALKEEWCNSPRTIDCKKGKSRFRVEQRGSHDIQWEKEISFSERNPTRLHVVVRPVITNPKGDQLVKNKPKLAVKFFIKNHIDEWFPWKKSFRFEMNEDYDDYLKQLFIRRPDAAKLFANHKGEDLGRRSIYNEKSILCSKDDDSSKVKESRTLKILTWDIRNIGRSTQFLALMLLDLEETEDLLLLDSPFPDSNMDSPIPEFIESLKALDTTNLYNEDYTGVKVRNVEETKVFLKESEKYSRITLATIGVNGPSVKKIIDSIDSNQNLVIYGKDEFIEQISALEVRSVHRSFMRGVFSIIPIKEDHCMKQLEDMWLTNAHQVSHVTWLTRTNTEAKETAIPSNLLCTMDKTGKVLHVFDWNQREVLELFLYLVFYNLGAVEHERFSLSTPHVEDFAEQTRFEPNESGKIQFSRKEGGYDPQDAELWFTQIYEGTYKHYVADAKAVFKQPATNKQSATNPLKWAESQFTSLKTKYNWETSLGYIRVLMLSMYGVEDGSIAYDNPYLFSRQVFNNTKPDDNSNVSRIFYSLEVAKFSDYVKFFLTNDTKNAVPKSFQEYSNHDVTEHSNLQAVLPFRQSKSNPQKNQTSFYFFRRKPSKFKIRCYSGFFFDPETNGFQNAFYFHNKRIEEIATYALGLLELEHNFEIKVSICGQFLCFSKPQGFKSAAFRFRSKYGYKKHLITSSTRKKNIRRPAFRSYEKTFSTRRNLRRNTRLSLNRFVGRGGSSHRRIKPRHTPKFKVGVDQLLDEENLDRFNESIRKNLAERRTMLTIEQVKKLLSPPMLTVEQVKELQSLLQITPWLDIEPPILAWPPRDSALDALSRWAQEVFFRMYSMAEENIMKKSETPTANDIMSGVNSLFQRASVRARNDGADPMNSLGSFMRGLNFFCSWSSVKAERRYQRYLELKAKRSSQSSQSDA